jgi:hypothetical protein
MKLCGGGFRLPTTAVQSSSYVRTTGKFAIVMAWAMLVLVVAASLDKVPDDPAVLTQVTIRGTSQGDHHHALPVSDAPVAVATLAFGGLVLGPEETLALHGNSPASASHLRLLQLAADSSPPPTHKS